MGGKESEHDFGKKVDRHKGQPEVVKFRDDDFYSLAALLRPEYPGEWIALEMGKADEQTGLITGRIIAHSPVCQHALTKAMAPTRRKHAPRGVEVRLFSTDMARL